MAHSMIKYIPLDRKITLKILEFILNWVEQVETGFLLSLMCMFPESIFRKPWSHGFCLQNSGILQTKMGQ